jgi:putative DNA primase/helicase
MTEIITEDSIALEFAARHEGKLRYVNATSPKKWLIWNEDTVEWRADDTLYVLSLVREVCREAAARCADPVISREITSAQSISAVERLARSDRRLAATKEQVGIIAKQRSRKGRAP